MFITLPTANMAQRMSLSQAVGKVSSPTFSQVVARTSKLDGLPEGNVVPSKPQISPVSYFS